MIQRNNSASTPQLIRAVACLCLVASLLGTQCVINLAGGTTTETTNGYAMGILVTDNGLPAAYTRVTLLPAQYNPVVDPAVPDSMSDTTNESGAYVIKTSQPGFYTLEAEDLSTGHKTLITGIHITDDTVAVPVATVRMPGAIKVMLPDSVDALYGYVYVPGTTVSVFLNNRNDFVVLDSVPAGTMPAVYSAATNSSVQKVIRYNIPVPSGDTVTIANPAWKYAKQLFLNTSASGAGVSGAVINFPVIVRLTGSNFNFSEADAGGNDLRFTKADTAPLFYEIERWDSAAGKAEIWVKVDTVQGNNSTQYLTMYWGNAQASDVSNTAAVFDTSASGGFQGVWHMGQAGTAPANDATANGFSGIPYHMTTASSVNGMIGRAMQFDGASSYIEVPNSATGKLDFPENGTYSLSAWVYLDRLVLQKGYVFISKGDYQYNLEVDRENNFWHMSEYHDGVGLQRLGTPATARAWTLVTGVRNGTAMSLYINGQRSNASSWMVNFSFVQDTAFNVFFGRIGNMMERYMSGTLDEIRISSVSYTPDWIKLCYMNQKTVDALLKW